MLAAPPPIGYSTPAVNRQGLQSLGAPGPMAFGGAPGLGAPALQPGFGYGMPPAVASMAQALAGSGQHGGMPSMPQGMPPMPTGGGSNPQLGMLPGMPQGMNPVPVPSILSGGQGAMPGLRSG